MEYAQDIPRLDNKAPSCPDGTGTCQGEVLSHRQLLCWAAKVTNAGDDECPL